SLSGFQRISYLDSAGASLKTNDLTSDGILNGQTFTVPTGATSLQVHYDTRATDVQLMINEGEILLPYEEFGYKFNEPLSIKSTNLLIKTPNLFNPKKVIVGKAIKARTGVLYDNVN